MESCCSAPVGVTVKAQCGAGRFFVSRETDTDLVSGLVVAAPADLFDLYLTCVCSRTGTTILACCRHLDTDYYFRLHMHMKTTLKYVLRRMCAIPYPVYSRFEILADVVTVVGIPAHQIVDSKANFFLHSSYTLHNNCVC